MRKISKDTLSKYKEKKENKRKRDLIEKISITAIVVLLIIGIIVLYYLTNKTKKRLTDSSKEVPEYAVNLDQTKYQETVEQVKDKGEMARIKVYLGDIFDNIENKKYDEIYARLDDNYKEKFFPKVEVLKDYFEGEFPSDAGYVIKNFERIDTLYVYIIDIASIKDDRKKTDMRFVFEEYDLNDYKFSFSKK